MIAAAMIVGPGEALRYLDRTLRRASYWADEIIVYGDGCEADTWDACRHWATLTGHGDQNRFPVNESEVRNRLLHLCDLKLDDGDLVVVIDADEDLRAVDGSNPTGALRRLREDRSGDAWPVEFRHLWAPDGSQIRTDGGWQPAGSYRIYRHRRGLHIPLREMACPPIPMLPHAAGEPSLAMYHWGYARPHDRELKYERYMDLDGGRYHSIRHLRSIIEEPTLCPS